MYLNVDQAAEHLGVTPRWIYGHAREIPHRKFGGFLRFTVVELDKWADSKRFEAA